jgi:hypothetical protein
MIFLGGTVGINTWREWVTLALIDQGIPEDVLYNPVVEHWTPEVQQREDEIKKTALMLYVIASPAPASETTNVSAYSISEALMGLYDAPERTVVVFDYQGWPHSIAKRIKKIARDWQGRFPGAPIYESYDDAIQRLVEVFHGE